MAQPTDAPARVVADIGGTHTRLALFDPQSGTLQGLRRYRNRDFEQLANILENWLGELEAPRPSLACFAIAAPPPYDRQITMINIDWSFSVKELAQRCGFSHLKFVNDFQGNAYALPHLDAGDVFTLHPGEALTGAKLATVGPGTGLGGSTLDLSSPLPIACASEPGHMGLAPLTDLEFKLFQYLKTEHGEVFGELLLCGEGLARLYRALAVVHGQDVPELTPEKVSAKALAGECPVCVDALHTFCALFGSMCGDFVLANGAYGGLYVAGGIMPQLLEFLRESSFAERFRDKGKMRDHLARVPLHVITGETTGLLGAAHAPL